jgi:TetR/AcrR family transcriptional regulator, cholesterol catabolism regulator
MTNRKDRPKDANPDMRGTLLDLAKDLFSRRGYIGASLRDLAEVAGVTAAAVYYHFSKKEDLLREIIFDGLEELSEDVVGALAGEGTPEQRLEALVRAHLGYNVENPRESRIIIEESRFLNEVDYAAAREKQMAILNAYRACIRQVMASGRIGEADPSLVAFGIISVIGGWYRWYREDGPVPKEQAFDYMVGFAMAGALHGATARAPA